MKSRAMTVAAAASLVGAMSAAAPTLTSAERQHLVAHLEVTAAWLADEVADLTASQAGFRPAPDAWTIAEVLEHLVVVAPIYWQDLQSALKQPAGAGLSVMKDEDVLWYGIDRTAKEQAIPGERPSGALRNLGAGMETYRKHHGRLLQYIKTTGDDLRSHFVPRQRCDAYQWALLISTHEQRHVLQIREIKGHPRFPTR